uniref:BLOC-1-related complex subunit 5 n=1 Tax=Rhabditophanes sp. KR3021 TaxID=114890 RepID=A0AC35TTE7_9BILA
MSEIAVQSDKDFEQSNLHDSETPPKLTPEQHIDLPGSCTNSNKDDDAETSDPNEEKQIFPSKVTELFQTASICFNKLGDIAHQIKGIQETGGQQWLQQDTHKLQECITVFSNNLDEITKDIQKRQTEHNKSDMIRKSNISMPTVMNYTHFNRPRAIVNQRITPSQMNQIKPIPRPMAVPSRSAPNVARHPPINVTHTDISHQTGLIPARQQSLKRAMPSLVNSNQATASSVFNSGGTQYPPYKNISNAVPYHNTATGEMKMVPKSQVDSMQRKF